MTQARRELFIPFDRARERFDRAREDSDASFFLALMYAGEFALKLLALQLVSALEGDSAQFQYEFEYRLVRSDGLGDWKSTLDEVTLGPPSSHLLDEARPAQVAYTKNHGPDSEAWQREATDRIEAARSLMDPSFQTSRRQKVALRTWADSFVWLRNKARAHGAPPPSLLARVAEDLEESVARVLDYSAPNDQSWAFLQQTQKRKYRVSCFGGERHPFLYLTQETDHQLVEGCYTFWDRPRRVNLLVSDPELRDFLVPNGAFRAVDYESLSYLTGDVRKSDSAKYQVPIKARPRSETSAPSQLDIVGNVYSNMPPRREGYIQRPKLQEELKGVLIDTRNPMVTLQGRGGVGKTSLALDVLHQLSESTQFESIIWMSARDIDLLPEGPKQVRPDVLTVEEIARSFARLMNANENPEEYLTTTLSGDGAGGPLILVLDNFETISDPIGVYAFLNNAVRPPNKVLITTRTRDFKGDYPIEIRGLNRSEFDALIAEVSHRLSLPPLSDEYFDTLFERSDGHPYITRVLLGEVSRRGKAVDLPVFVKTNDALLDALFERTHSALSVPAQRVFFTLASWNSRIPVLGLSAVLLRGAGPRIDVERAVDELHRSSLVQIDVAEDGGEFVSVPLAAALFGRKKLVTSAWKLTVESDLSTLRELGTTTASQVAAGLGPRVDALIRAARSRWQAGEEIEAEVEVVQFMASDFAPAWLSLARLAKERGMLPDATMYVNRYLERNPTDAPAWRELVDLLRQQQEHWAELNALVQLARLDSIRAEEVSDIAGRANYLMSEFSADIGRDERDVLVKELRGELEARKHELSATDMSRLAWLCIYDRDEGAALYWATKGLALDSSNEYCQNLVAKLHS